MTSANARRGLAALFRRRDGAAAVEFSLVVIPLFWLIFGMLEFGAMSLAQSDLDHAVAEAGGKIRTGSAQNEDMTRQDLEGEICADLNKIMTLACPDNLFLDVDRYDSFAAVDSGAPTGDGAMNMAQIGYQPGAGDEVILVRAYYQWEIFTPMFSAIFANMNGGKRLIVSSMLFRNEPF